MFIWIFTFSALSSIVAQKVSVQALSMESQGDPYAELHFFVDGESLKSEPLADSTFRSRLEVLLTFEQGEEIVEYDRFELKHLAERPPNQLHRHKALSASARHVPSQTSDA